MPEFKVGDIVRIKKETANGYAKGLLDHCYGVEEIGDCQMLQCIGKEGKVVHIIERPRDGVSVRVNVDGMSWTYKPEWLEMIVEQVVPGKGNFLEMEDCDFLIPCGDVGPRMGENACMINADIRTTFCNGVDCQSCAYYMPNYKNYIKELKEELEY